MSIKLNKILGVIFAVLLLLSVGGIEVNAQNNTSSPYSLYGIGDAREFVNGRSFGMGGSGIAMRSDRYINPLNAASYTSLDSMRFYYDIGVMTRVTWGRSNSEFNTLIDGNVTGVMAATRVLDGWFLGLGFAPKSSIGYNMRKDETVDGIDVDYSEYWSGTGGFSEIYLDNGFKIYKGLSLGVHTAFTFGPRNYYKQTVVTVPTSVETTTKSNEGGYYGFAYGLGLQYTHKIGEKGADLTLGATYDFETKMYGKYQELTVVTSSRNGYRDTLNYGGDRIATVESIPENYGIGLAYRSPSDVTISADYRMIPWEDVPFSELINDYGDVIQSTYKNQYIINAGVEIIPDKGSRHYMNRVSYRLGGRYDSGYLLMAVGQPIDDWGFSAGFGFPVGKQLNYINLGVEWGDKGTYEESLVRERYLGFNMSCSFSDIWYLIRQFN